MVPNVNAGDSGAPAEDNKPKSRAKRARTKTERPRTRKAPSSAAAAETAVAVQADVKAAGSNSPKAPAVAPRARAGKRTGGTARPTRKRKAAVAETEISIETQSSPVVEVPVLDPPATVFAEAVEVEFPIDDSWSISREPVMDELPGESIPVHVELERVEHVGEVPGQERRGRGRRRRRGRRGGQRNGAPGAPPAVVEPDLDDLPESESEIIEVGGDDRELEIVPTKETGRDSRRRRGRRPRPGRDLGATELTPIDREETVDDDDDDGPAIAQEITRFASTKPAARPVSGAPVREMVINVSGADECRIAILQDGRLEELFIERGSAESHVGNIYKGRIVNVEPSIQAAFVDFGLPKHGFLHVSDVQPQYFPDYRGGSEEVGRKTPRHHRPPIQRCFRRGQEVIVQIIKEGVGTKGPTLTTYLSIPGRFLVMMPGMVGLGVSRKIEDEGVRRQMRGVLSELKLPQGMGFILRTAGLDRGRRELQRDLNYLYRLWKTVVERVQSQSSPAELYRESDLVTRTIRDIYSAEFSRLVVDDATTAKDALEFLQIAMPRARTVVELYLDREPIFHRFGIEEEIDRINQRRVPLKSGGYLIIDSTEALVAIDVNSGRFRSPDDAEETAYKINIEAADEIARQLLLRDLGGLIVCDFIDMRLDRHKRSVERALKDALKKHKERARILRMSAFGLIELTRQRQGPSIKRNIYFDCAHCKGSGLVKMPESVILDVMRLIQLAVHHNLVTKVTATVSSEVAFQLLNSKRAALAAIETETSKSVVVRGDSHFTTDQVDIACVDGRGQPVVLEGLRPLETSPREKRQREWGKSREEPQEDDRESTEFDA